MVWGQGLRVQKFSACRLAEGFAYMHPRESRVLMYPFFWVAVKEHNSTRHNTDAWYVVRS